MWNSVHACAPRYSTLLLTGAVGLVAPGLSVSSSTWFINFAAAGFCWRLVPTRGFRRQPPVMDLREEVELEPAS